MSRRKISPKDLTGYVEQNMTSNFTEIASRTLYDSGRCEQRYATILGMHGDVHVNTQKRLQPAPPAEVLQPSNLDPIKPSMSRFAGWNTQSGQMQASRF